MSETIPAGWHKCQLVDICKVVTGKTPSKSIKEYFGGNILFVKPPDLDKDIFITTSQDTLSEYGFKKAVYLPKYSILVSCIGNLGKKGILLEEGSCNQQINAILPNDSVYYKYIYYYIDIIKSWMEENSSATTVAILNKSKFEKAPIIFPHLEEQQAIVSKIESEFEKIDLAIAKLENTLELLEKYKQSILKYAFDENSPFAKGNDYIPYEWEKTEIKNISKSIEYGYTTSTIKDNTGTQLLRITDIKDNYVNWEEVLYCKVENDKKEKYLLKNGDLLFARTGATVGKSYLIDNLLDNQEIMYASYLIRIRFNENYCNRYYIKYFFQSNDYWEQIHSNKIGIAQPNVNGTKLGKIRLKLPDLKLQETIAKNIQKYFKNNDKLKNIALENIQKLKQLKQTILKKAFSGELI